jgi:hypothetical protein
MLWRRGQGLCIIGMLLAACSGGKDHRTRLTSPFDAPPPLSTPSPNIQLGDVITLLKHGQFGLTYFPDEGTSLIERSPSLRLVVTARNSSYLVEGTDMQHLSGATLILSPGGKGEFDNGYAGISAVVQLGHTYYGFYHAEDQEGLPGLAGGIPGFYASIGLATSDDGKVWRKRGQVITSSQPKSWTAYSNQGDRGAAEPGATMSKDGRFVYLYYSEHSRVQGRGVDICLARADLKEGPPLPGAFRKYYKGAFSEPGLGGRDTPVMTARGFPSANALEGHVTYSKKAEKYLMVFGIDAYRERMAGEPPISSGLYVAWSDDGIAWAKPLRLIADQAIPQPGKSLSWEGSIVFDDDTGGTGTLIYGYTPNWGVTPHYMVGRRVIIGRSE